MSIINWQIEPIIESVFEPNIAILAQRRDSSGHTSIVEGHVPLNFSPAKNMNGESEANLANICGIVPRMRILAVSDGSRSLKRWFLQLIGVGRDREKLKRGDIVVRLDDVNNPTFAEMREITKAYENNDLAGDGSSHGFQRY